VTWSQTLPDDPVWVRGWEPGLRLLVDNLLENAARHGRPDGRVRVAVDPEPVVVLAVEDDGPGIAPEDRERIFEPFTRIEATEAPGSGLGLALVRQQVRAHHARIEVGDSPAGGARFEVRFG
jgi:signal transduction histidine kinase